MCFSRIASFCALLLVSGFGCSSQSCVTEGKSIVHQKNNANTATVAGEAVVNDTDHPVCVLSKDLFYHRQGVVFDRSGINALRFARAPECDKETKYLIFSSFWSKYSKDNRSYVFMRRFSGVELPEKPLSGRVVKVFFHRFPISERRGGGVERSLLDRTPDISTLFFSLVDLGAGVVSGGDAVRVDYTLTSSLTETLNDSTGDRTIVAEVVILDKDKKEIFRELSTGNANTDDLVSFMHSIAVSLAYKANEPQL